MPHYAAHTPSIWRVLGAAFRSSTEGLGVGAMRARWVPQRFAESAPLGETPSGAPFQDSGVFIRGFPPNKKTTRQRIKTTPRSGFCPHK